MTEALAWMIEDGVAKSVNCNAEIVDKDMINVAVTIERPDGESEGFAYEIKWMATDGI